MKTLRPVAIFDEMLRRHPELPPGDDRHGSNYRRQVVNEFLAEMDSLSRDEGVIVVGTCNDVTAIDPAVLRQPRVGRMTTERRPSGPQP